jgi:alpha-glucuronidase
MRFLLALILSALVMVPVARAEDGYQLWLRYRPLERAAMAQLRPAAAVVVTASLSPTADITAKELVRGLSGLEGRSVPTGDSVRQNGTVLFGTPASSPTIAALHLPLERVGAEGFVIRSAVARGHKLIVIAGNSDVGVLHGAFAFLRLVQSGTALDRLDVVEAPKIALRMLNHWDNVDRTIERGFSGFSIFN